MESKKTYFLILVLAIFCLSNSANSQYKTNIYNGLEFNMPSVGEPEFPDYSVSITEFGAVGDGQTLNTKAISKAIESAAIKGKQDDTHFCAKGDEAVATLVIEELKQMPVILAGHVLEKRTVIGLDNWFNREYHKKTGKLYHYLWTDTENSGFSQLGDLFKENGSLLKTVDQKPTQDILGNLDVYIIVDPDTTTESKNPNYIASDDINAIENWVKKGGVLLLMANDGPNCEFTHFNLLAETFGFHFVPVTLNPVINRDWEMGAETDLPKHPLFKGVQKIYMKEVAPIKLSKNSKSVLVDGNDVFIAETTYGKGRVVAIGDPWLYNEYIDHDRLPESFQNKKAARNLVKYLISK